MERNWRCDLCCLWLDDMGNPHRGAFGVMCKVSFFLNRPKPKKMVSKLKYHTVAPNMSIYKTWSWMGIPTGISEDKWPDKGGWEAGLHKLWYPSIRDTSKWSKFGAHGEHGDVFLFSNLSALWFSENLIRYSLHICLREVKNNLFSFKNSYLRHFSWRF